MPAPTPHSPQAAGSTQAEAPRASIAHYNLNKDGLAIQGYDPVSYFPEGGAKPQRGDPALSLRWQGVNYRFASEDNRLRFLNEPGRYEPAYGGWCAYAMAQGEKVEIDPSSFRVRGGRLFLFYKSFFNDTRKKWVGEEAKLSVAADADWQKISKEKLGRNAALYALAEDDLALSGYDPVSYFATQAEKPLRGNPAYFLRHEGVLYQFATEVNRELFRAEPGKYEPLYGGWSAAAVAEGSYQLPEPQDYLMENGRLVLFHRSSGQDIRARWTANQERLSAQAQAQWLSRTGGRP